MVTDSFLLHALIAHQQHLTTAVGCGRVPSSLRPVFAANQQPPEHLYTQQEAADALRSYAQNNSLTATASGTDGLQLDRFLVGLLGLRCLTV